VTSGQSAREEDAVSLVNTHQFMGRAARGSSARGTGENPGEQGGWKARGGFILNEAGVITAISADITPVVRQSPQHSIISVPRGLSAMQKMDFPADRDRVDARCRDSVIPIETLRRDRH